MTERTELLTRIEAAIARVTFSHAAAEVLAEIERTHRLIEIDETAPEYDAG